MKFEELPDYEYENLPEILPQGKNDSKIKANLMNFKMKYGVSIKVNKKSSFPMKGLCVISGFPNIPFSLKKIRENRSLYKKKAAMCFFTCFPLCFFWSNWFLTRSFFVTHQNKKLQRSFWGQKKQKKDVKKREAGTAGRIKKWISVV